MSYIHYINGDVEDTSNVVIGQQVGQIARFLLEIGRGDYIITPAADTEYIYYGTLDLGDAYYADQLPPKGIVENYYLSLR